ncbi:DHH family phosphoesterase [Candidatus Pacearchaeota archaeon]|nr:DHH family phosphoesterase [Candidatus Pacearchaeota archaeon]
MGKITFEEAKEFLNKITNEDKVAIIHHDDGDGFCSGILYYDWCKEAGAEVEEFTYVISKSKIKDFDLKKFNKIIFTDLASGFMAEQLNIISDKEVFYTDHHPEEGVFPKEILTFITDKDGYIPSSRTAGKLTGIKPFLALTGTITDSGDLYAENDEFINSHLDKLGISLDDFKKDISSVISNTLSYLDKNHKKAFELLHELESIVDVKGLRKYADKIEDEIEKFVNEFEEEKEMIASANFYYFEPVLNVKGPVTGIISHSDHKKIYIFASPKEDGKYISLSARNTSQNPSMVEMLRAGVEGLEDGNAGGHPPAAGGMIHAKDLDKFKDNIREFLEK